ncbi:Hypothetical predicted protein [Marmota monax]|uniref:Uncharacterized protein n=1 Tax=Marmota monax TaxID=9995 RepID=A0A5E4A848_MARMO|nr:Hypothetical predicted protein [Marmota monax]
MNKECSQPAKSLMHVPEKSKAQSCCLCPYCLVLNMCQRMLSGARDKEVLEEGKGDCGGQATPDRRMPQLSLSWLGLGPWAASPWQLLLLAGASWFLARSLTKIYTFYDNCYRLRCFPQPPRRNWFWGHLGLAQNNEEGMRLVEELGHCFRDVHLWWVGPLYPVLRLVHPKFVAPLLQAPGISPSPDPWPLFPVPVSSPSHLWIGQAEPGKGRYPIKTMALPITGK